MEWLINNVYWNDGIIEAVVRRCSATQLKKRLNFSNLLRAPIFIEHPQWLLLELVKPIGTSMELHAFL